MLKHLWYIQSEEQSLAILTVYVIVIKFKESVEHRRGVAPVTWFYKWNKNKEKNIFFREGHSAFYMAGLYNHYQNEDRLVILTTVANESMNPVLDGKFQVDAN